MSYVTLSTKIYNNLFLIQNPLNVLSIDFATFNVASAFPQYCRSTPVPIYHFRVNDVFMQWAEIKGMVCSRNTCISIIPRINLFTSDLMYMYLL